MIYLLGLAVLLALGVLAWRAFVADGAPGPSGRTVAPDDDPEFLARIDPAAGRHRPADGDGEDPGPTSR